MGIILCATGNGPQSRLVQTAAVEAALAQNKQLILLHVVDLRQLGELEESLLPAARTEMAWLGEAVLRLAEDRAKRRGVRTDNTILYGNVCEALETYMRGRPVDLLLMGEATSGEITAFARRVREELGVAVEFVTGS